MTRARSGGIPADAAEIAVVYARPLKNGRAFYSPAAELCSAAVAAVLLARRERAARRNAACGGD